jgi:GNAT superfamily N-acetyltransferase
MPSKKQRSKMNAKCKKQRSKMNAKKKKDPMDEWVISFLNQNPPQDPIRKKIFKMICDYDWIYTGEVGSEIMAEEYPLFEGIHANIEKIWGMLNDPNGQEDCGFHITYIYPNMTAEVQYIFIIPECRRKGIATAYLESLKEDYSKIIVNTAETPMKECIKKLGYEFDRICDNGREESWEFNNS